MSGSIYMAASGALYNQRRLEVLSNNLANINTTGFKEEKTYFRVDETPPAVREGLLNSALTPSAPTSPLWQELESRTVFSQGGLKSTGNPLDLALDGDGFFCVQTPEGVRYTRNGSFTLNAEGELTTQDGFAVLGEGGAVALDAGAKITVDEAGNLAVDGVPAARLRLVEFEQPWLLRRMGATLFAPPETGAGEISPKRVSVRQGHLELSNVEAVRTMTEMIEVLRGYESYQRAIRQLDETQAKAINEVGRLV